MYFPANGGELKGSMKQSGGEGILKHNRIFQLCALAGFFLVGLFLFTAKSWAIDMDCGRNVINLTPNVPYNGNTIGGPLSVSSYGCTSWSEGGPHRIHRIETGYIHGDITATLSNLNGVDLDVFILKDKQCESNNCVAGDTGTTYTQAPPGTHYIVVDGYSTPEITAQGPYTLTVNAVCSAPVNLTLGAPYNGTTVGAPSNVSSYNCSGWTESGPEVVHRITTTMTGDLRAELSNLGGVDLDVFILSDCTAGSCLPGAAGDNAAIYSNAPPGTYYIVVDGYLSAAGSYTLTVTGPPTTLIFGYGQVQDGLNYEITAQVDSYTSINDLGNGSYRISGNANVTLGQRTINFNFTDLTAEISGASFKITAGFAYSILDLVIDMSAIDAANLKYNFAGIVLDSTGANASGWLNMPEGTMIGDGNYPDPYMIHTLDMRVTSSLDFRYTVPDISQWFFRADDLPVKFKPKSRVRFLPQKIEIGASDIEYIDRSSLSDSPGGSFDVANDGYFKLSKWRVALDILASGIEASFELNNTEFPAESYATLFPLDAVVFPLSGYLQVSGNHIVNGEFNNVYFVFMHKSTDCDNNTGMKFSTLSVYAPAAKIGEDGSIYADKDNVQLQDTSISWGNFTVTRNTNDPVELYVPGFIAWAEIKDTDGDRVKDFNDQCPSTPKGTNVNSAGCGVAETADSPRNRVEDHFIARRNGEDFFSQMPGSGIYAGLNILEAQTLTAKIGGTILMYPLKKTLFHMRLGGITGVTDAGAVNTDTTIYSYNFSFSNFGLNYLDSSPGDTVVDGSVYLPWPSDFALDLKGISMCGCADLGKSPIEQPAAEKNIGYWDTDFTPLGIVFQGDVSSSSCDPGNNNRTLYVSMTHPIRHFTEEVSTLTPFHPQGVPGKINNNQNYSDASGKIPDVLSSQLTFDGFTTFPEKIRFSLWNGNDKATTLSSKIYGNFELLGNVSFPHFGLTRMGIRPYRGECADGIHDKGENSNCGDPDDVLSKVDVQAGVENENNFLGGPLTVVKEIKSADVILFTHKYGLNYQQPKNKDEKGLFHSYKPDFEIPGIFSFKSSLLMTPDVVKINYGFLADAAYYWALQDFNSVLIKNLTADSLNKYKKDYENAKKKIADSIGSQSYLLSELTEKLPSGKTLTNIVKDVRPEDWAEAQVGGNSSPFPSDNEYFKFTAARFAGSAAFTNQNDWDGIYADTRLKTVKFVEFDSSFQMKRFVVNDGVSPQNHLEMEFKGKDVEFDFKIKKAKAKEVLVILYVNTPPEITGMTGSVTLADVDLGKVKFKELMAEFGAGKNEPFFYFGGQGNGSFSGYTASGALLVGKTRDKKPLERIDPDVASMLPIPTLTGLYARLDTSFPIVSASCVFEVGVQAGVGTWVFLEGPTFGGRIRGAVYGTLLCLVSGRGDITLLGNITANGLSLSGLMESELAFKGKGFAALGIGACEPNEWTCPARVWEDNWCWTCVLDLELEYIRKWDVNYDAQCE
jgi:hypothetical protein